MMLGNIAAALLGLGLIVLRILAQTELWQRKEYRLDRIRSLLLSREVTAILSPLFACAILFVALAHMAVRLRASSLTYWLAWAALAAFAAHDIYRLHTRGLFRPVFTAKAKAIVAGAGLITGFFLIFWRVATPLQWATAVLAAVPIVALVTAIINIPFAIRRSQIIKKAHGVRQQLPELRVVGITGSYGKTSTKYFLQQLLSELEGVAATAEHRNSDIAVAQDMLQQLTPDTRLYIAEMGAYRRGEIAAVAKLAQPHVGVITAIGSQHIALFGSQQALLSAKWELIDALPKSGIAVLNYDDMSLRERAKKLPQRIVWYSALESAPRKTEIDKAAVNAYVEQVQLAPLATSCVLHINGTSQQIVLPLVSQALLSSAVAAAAAASALDIPAAVIFEKLTALQPFPRTMEVTQGLHNATIIDDSYSANEQGVLAALTHLSRFADSKKIVVLTPLIELGATGPAVHQRIGAALARTGAVVYVTNSSYAKALLSGGRSVQKDFNLMVLNKPVELSHELARVVTGTSVVLLEGRLPEVVRRGLL